MIQPSSCMYEKVKLFFFVVLEILLDYNKAVPACMSSCTVIIHYTVSGFSHEKAAVPKYCP